MAFPCAFAPLANSPIRAMRQNPSESLSRGCPNFPDDRWSRLGAVATLVLMLSLSSLGVVVAKEAGGINAVETPAQTRQEKTSATVLARVGGTSVTAGALYAYALQQPRLLDRLNTPDGRRLALRQVIENRLINRAARARAELAPDGSAAEVSKARAALEDEWRQVDVDDQAVRDFYDQHKERYGIPSAVRVREIFFPYPDRATDAEKAQVRVRAATVLKRAQAGESLAELAAQHAHTAALRAVQGDQGFLPVFRLNPELAQALSQMDVGEVTELIDLGTGLQIAQLLDRRPGVPARFEDVQPRVRLDLAQQLYDQRRQALITEVARDVEIEILDPDFAGAWPSVAPSQAPSE